MYNLYLSGDDEGIHLCLEEFGWDSLTIQYIFLV